MTELKSLKNNIRRIEALQGGRDLELRREYNALVGGSIMPYLKHKWYGKSAKKEERSAQKELQIILHGQTPEKKGYWDTIMGAWNSAAAKKREIAAKWNSFVNSEGVVSTKARLSAFKKWAKENGVNATKQSMDLLERGSNNVSDMACNVAGRASKGCTTHPRTTDAFLRSLEEKDLKRLSDKVAARLTYLENKKKRLKLELNPVKPSKPTPMPSSAGEGSKIVFNEKQKSMTRCPSLNLDPQSAAASWCSEKDERKRKVMRHKLFMQLHPDRNADCTDEATAKLQEFQSKVSHYNETNSCAGSL